jgi:hypothetical protein
MNLNPGPVRSFGIDDILHKPLDFSQSSLQQLQHNLRHVHSSFPYKYMNNYMANFQQTHTVTSRDVEQTDKIESTCRRENPESSESAQSGNGD